MSVQKTLLSFVEVENSLLALLPLSVANNNNSDCSQRVRAYVPDPVPSLLPRKHPSSCYSQSYRC